MVIKLNHVVVLLFLGVLALIKICHSFDDLFGRFLGFVYEDIGITVYPLYLIMFFGENFCLR